MRDRPYMQPPLLHQEGSYDTARWDTVAQATAKVRATYNSWVTAGTVPVAGEVLGEGILSVARIVGDGELVERTPHDKFYVEDYVDALVRGLDVVCLEQIVAASPASTYSKRLHGVAEDGVTAHLTAQLGSDHMEDTLDALTHMQWHDLGMDVVNKGNILIHPDHGISILDYHRTRLQRMLGKITKLGTMLGYSGISTLAATVGDEWSSQALAAEIEGRLPAMRLLAQAVGRRAIKTPPFWNPSLQHLNGQIVDMETMVLDLGQL